VEEKPALVYGAGFFVSFTRYSYIKHQVRSVIMYLYKKEYRMKRNAMLIALFAMFAVTFSSAQKLDDVLKKYYEARGGLKNIKAVQTIQSTGKMSIMGKEYPLVMYQKRSGGYRSEFTMGKSKIVQAYDGKNGWQIIPMTGSPDPADMSEGELRSVKEDADLDGFLIDSQQKGYKIELIGKEKLSDADVFHIKIVRKDTTEHHIFLNAKTYLPVRHSEKINVQGKEMEILTMLGDYKKVGKLMFPYSMEMTGGMPQKLTFDTVVINKPIDDALFVKPQVKE
jgi:hypothetical protein